MITLVFVLLSILVFFVLFGKNKDNKIHKLLSFSVFLWLFYTVWLYSGSPLPFGLEKQPLPPYPPYSQKSNG